ncbi:MAG: M28 family peptidase [Pirellulales bacterium]
MSSTPIYRGSLDRGPFRSSRLATWLCLASLALAAASIERMATADEATAEEQRLAEAAKYLSSDELQGRGIGTEGLDKAADYIAAQFKKMGLKTDLYDGGPFQEFKMTIGAELGPKNEATLTGPVSGTAPEGEKLVLKLDEDFRPLASGNSGVLDLPLVFVGYGISAKDEMYDDYAGLDVAGKAVLILRKEPQQNDPHSAFNGTQPSSHAPFARKLSNAYEHGAAAVIFVQDAHGIREGIAGRQKQWQESLDKLAESQTAFKAIEKPTREQLDEQRKQVEELIEQIRKRGAQMQAEYDPLLGFQATGPETDGRPFPVLTIRREVADRLFKAVAGTDLEAIEAQIDDGPTPKSMELAGWKITGEVSVNRKEAHVKNVVAVMEAEGPLADETVVIGAHYDHLGSGGEGSLAPGVQEIHNGADDNASGSAALLDVAWRLSTLKDKLKRRVVFMAFTGEERGLIGSAYQVKHPLIEPEKIVAMLNMDMVGRLNEEKLIIQGTDTATEFAPLIDRLNEKYGFKITKQAGGFGPSDHSSFYAKQIPVMHFYTGTHPDYHRPSDDFDKLNLSGMQRVAQMVAETAADIANADARPEFLESKAKSAALGGGGDRPYFGSIPDFAQEKPGYALTGVTKDGPAEKAGIKAGDNIIKLGESKIGNLEDFDSALRKYKAGDKVPVTVERDGKEVTVEVTLDPPK